MPVLSLEIRLHHAYCYKLSLLHPPFDSDFSCKKDKFLLQRSFFFFSFFLEINKLNDPMDNAAVKG